MVPSNVGSGAPDGNGEGAGVAVGDGEPGGRSALDLEVVATTRGSVDAPDAQAPAATSAATASHTADRRNRTTPFTTTMMTRERNEGGAGG
jgi:hypothetical protein